jgi:hypothetical protein
VSALQQGRCGDRSSRRRGSDRASILSFAQAPTDETKSFLMSSDPPNAVFPARPGSGRTRYRTESESPLLLPSKRTRL